MKLMFEMPVMKITEFDGELIKTEAGTTPAAISGYHSNAYGMQSFTTLQQVTQAIEAGAAKSEKILMYQY